jgi:hypothetical protein
MLNSALNIHIRSLILDHLQLTIRLQIYTKSPSHYKWCLDSCLSLWQLQTTKWQFQSYRILKLNRWPKQQSQKPPAFSLHSHSNLLLKHISCWGLPPCGKWGEVVWWKFTDGSDEPAATKFYREYVSTGPSDTP